MLSDLLSSSHNNTSKPLEANLLSGTFTKTDTNASMVKKQGSSAKLAAHSTNSSTVLRVGSAHASRRPA
jgi:hypothetical protein